MKEYVTPALQVREIRVMENVANTPAGRALAWVESIPTTVFTFNSGSANT